MVCLARCRQELQQVLKTERLFLRDRDQDPVHVQDQDQDFHFCHRGAPRPRPWTRGLHHCYLPKSENSNMVWNYRELIRPTCIYRIDVRAIPNKINPHNREWI